MKKSKSNQANRAEWGYKGTETALNGLTEWMYKNTDINSYRRMLNLVILFGLECKTIQVVGDPDMDNKRSVQEFADIVAKQIQEKQLFQSFTDWVTKTLNK